jgi:hypothetical protein
MADIYDVFRILTYTVLVGAPPLAAYFIWRLRKEKEEVDWLAGRSFTVLQILVPKQNEKGPLAAEQMFATLHGIFKKEATVQDHISFEIAAEDKSIKFYIFVPTELRDFVEGQIYAQYPNVEIKEVEDYASAVTTTPELQVAGTELKLTNFDFYPIKTFQNFEVDPLSGITGVLSKIKPGERVWMQILVEPTGDAWQKAGMKAAAAMKKGMKLSPTGLSDAFSAKNMAKAGGLFVRDLVKTAAQGPAKVEEKPAPTALQPLPGQPGSKLTTTEAEGVKGVETKITKLGFKTQIRIVALSPDIYTAQSKVTGILGAFKQFGQSNLNTLAPAKDIVRDASILDAYKRRAMTKGYVMNTEELASIFHLPTITVETPTIAWVGSKKGEPPQELPVEGNVEHGELTIFAETNFRHLIQKFGIKLPDRRYHMYAIGKTGTGKSTLIENMAIDDIRKGRGVAVFDPHGDTVKKILKSIPSYRVNDVVYFNPADREHPVAFNLLENVDPDLKNVVASGLVGLIKKIFGDISWGPRLEYILRNVILGLLDYPDSTMLSIMKVLSDETYRKHVVAKITDPVVRDFFINEFEKYDPKFRTEAIAPVQNKVGQFLSSSTMRNILGQPHSTVDIEGIMNSGKIILANLSVGEIGEDASALLGGMLITKIQLAAMRRSTVPEEDRKDFYLYVDEFQNFATESFAVVLSEARKYRLNLFLTNQYIAQMPEAVRDAIFGNVGTMVSFRVGPQDGDVVAKEFTPTFEVNDVINLANYHIYLKMSVDGVTSKPFSAITLPPTAQDEGNEETIVRITREKYSRPRKFVEEKIDEWHKSWEDLGRKEARESREKTRRLDYLRQVEFNKRRGLPPPRPYVSDEGKFLEANEIKEEERKPAPEAPKEALEAPKAPQMHKEPEPEKKEPEKPSRRIPPPPVRNPSLKERAKPGEELPPESPDIPRKQSEISNEQKAGEKPKPDEKVLKEGEEVVLE